jgi:hypothetical protein
MLLSLLNKDLRRARRNPVPWAISLVVPLCITALIGSIFGPGSGGGSGSVGTIHLAVVDEDDTRLTEFLRGALEQARTGGDARTRPPFEMRARFLERAEAEAQIRDDAVAAAIVIPKGFTDGYLEARGPLVLQLIKNPARGIHPRIVEEMLGLAATALDGFQQLAGDQLPSVRAIFEEGDDDALTRMALAGGVLVEARRRLEPVRAYIAPPLITFAETERADPAEENGEARPGFNVFAFVLAGMAAMFLLYLADNAMRDLYREARMRTLVRFKTMREGLFAFIAGKAVFAVAMVLLGAAVLLGGGGLIFGVEWRAPLALFGLVFAYAFCAAGLLGLVAAVAGRERRADVFGNLFIMAMALVGGCMFPPEALPVFMREHLTPWMPPGWFASGLRALQDTGDANVVVGASIRFVAVGVVALVGAAWLFQRRLSKGGKA